MEKIQSRKNQNVLYFRRVLRENTLRKNDNVFALEGIKLISEAVSYGFEALIILTTQKSYAKNQQKIDKLTQNCPIYEISDDISAYISDTKTPQGLFAILKSVDNNENRVKINNGKRLLVLDDVQDAGNAGTMIRTAEAFSFDGMIFSENSVDFTTPKVIRSAMGSSLRLPLLRGNLSEEILALKQSGFCVYGAILDENATSLRQTHFTEKSVLVIGNEGKGISDEIKHLCDKFVYIEISGAESLNAAAAAAIICYEMNKQN